MQDIVLMSPYKTFSKIHFLSSSLFLSLCTLSESILETTSHGLHVTHTTGTCCATALSLLSPVVLPHLLWRVSARRASRFLDVVRNLSTSTAHSVRLIMPLSEWSRTLCLFYQIKVIEQCSKEKAEAGKGKKKVRFCMTVFMSTMNYSFFLISSFHGGYQQRYWHERVHRHRLNFEWLFHLAYFCFKINVPSCYFYCL